jgi:hypothetical protein
MAATKEPLLISMMRKIWARADVIFIELEDSNKFRIMSEPYPHPASTEDWAPWIVNLRARNGEAHLNFAFANPDEWRIVKLGQQWVVMRDHK